MSEHNSADDNIDIIAQLDQILNSKTEINIESKPKKKRTSKKNEKVSFLDINQKMFKLVREDTHWLDFMEFSKNLEKSMQEKYDTEIRNFWENYTATHTKNNIYWINNEQLRDCEEKIKKDRDRSHTSCFRNLKLNKSTLQITDLSRFEQLEKEFPNFSDVIALYKGFFVLNGSRNEKHYQAPRPLLLLGNPGIGKTRFAKRLAQVLGTDYKFLDSNSITSGWVLTGSNASWRGADAGFIFKTLAPCNTLSPVILLDEIDKLSSRRDYSPFSTFHQLLEPENSVTLYDEFLELEFNASFIIYILTANSIKDIPESLLTRMNVVEVQNPDCQQMRVISQNIYTELLAGSKLFKKELDEQTLSQLEKLLPREVDHLLSKNLFKLSAQQKKKENNHFSLIADTKKDYKFGF